MSVSKVTLNRAHLSRIDEIASWCQERFGKGSMRFRANTWLGTDDWFCYQDTPGEQIEDEDQGVMVQVQDLDDLDWIFAFRREEDAVIFSLHWS